MDPCITLHHKRCMSEQSSRLPPSSGAGAGWSGNIESVKYSSSHCQPQLSQPFLGHQEVQENHYEHALISPHESQKASGSFKMILLWYSSVSSSPFLHPRPAEAGLCFLLVSFYAGRYCMVTLYAKELRSMCQSLFSTEMKTICGSSEV